MEEKRKREAEKRTYEEEQVFCTVLCIFQKLTSKELSQRMKLLKIVVGLSLNEAVNADTGRKSGLIYTTVKNKSLFKVLIKNV